MSNNSRKSTIYNLYEAMHGIGYQNKDDAERGQYDAATGTYYCGKKARIDASMSKDVKRYIASRYYDYANKIASDDGKLLSQEELVINRYKAQAIKELMNKFLIQEFTFTEENK